MTTTNRRFKDAIYEQFARIGKAMAAPKRLEVLDLLCQGPRTVEALSVAAGLSVANTSQHLQILRGARLVASERKGTFIEYRLADEAVCQFYLSMRGLAESRLAEVGQVTRDYLQSRGALEPVAGEELVRRVLDGEVTVLDVRPAEEYRAGHVPGALSVPLAELRRRLAELPTDRAIVAYCRGPYCVLAIEAVEVLQAEGFRAHRMEQGVADWKALGLQLATGENTSTSAQ